MSLIALGSEARPHEWPLLMGCHFHSTGRHLTSINFSFLIVCMSATTDAVATGFYTSHAAASLVQMASNR